MIPRIKPKEINPSVEVVEEIRANGSRRVASYNLHPSLTQQQFKDSSDINNIMAKYLKNPQAMQLQTRKGFYADISEIQDYQTSLDKIMKADEAFLAMPATLRQRFNQDPKQLISFLADQNNREEAIKLGLIEKPARESVTQPPVTPTPPIPPQGPQS